MHGLDQAKQVCRVRGSPSGSERAPACAACRSSIFFQVRVGGGVSKHDHIHNAILHVPVQKTTLGISSAPEFFQRKMSQFLDDLAGACNTDDILIYGRTQGAHCAPQKDSAKITER